MTENAKQFAKFFMDNFGKKLEVEDRTEEDSIVWMNFDDDNGINVKMMLAFDKTDTMVHMYSSASNLKITNANRVNEILHVLNKYNSEYTVSKLVLEGDKICAESFLPFMDNFSPNVIVSVLSNLMDLTSDVYKTLSESGLLN